MNIDDLRDHSKDQYTTAGQQALTVAEGLGQGFAGPLATGVEAGLTKLGVPGLSPQEQALRAGANPVEHYGSEAAGFGAGALTGTGEAALVSKVGEGVVGAAQLPALGSLATAAIRGGLRGGAELAALQTGEEISKVINKDPSQTIGSAAINIGLSGILGGAGGAALGSVSSLFKSSLGKVDEFLADHISRTGAMQSAVEPLEKATSSGQKYADWANQKGAEYLANAGQKYTDWANQKGAEYLANAAGHGLAGTVGGVAGAVVGHPIAGAYAAERLLGPVFSNLAKPFAENAVNSEAAKATVDYLVNAVKGELVMNSAVKDFFKSAEVLPKALLPSEESRAKLQKSLDHMQNPQNMLAVGGGISHYMPEHATAAAATAGQGVQYLNSIKPRPVPASPFDAPPPIDKAQQAKYDRALDIAQQPLMVLKYAKDGTLTPQDVQTVQKIYPGFHSALVSKINNQLIDRHSANEPIPYPQRLALARLTGTPLDASMRVQNMQGIIMAQRTGSLQSQGQPDTKKASGVALKQINKVNNLYPTEGQSRQIQRRSR